MRVLWRRSGQSRAGAMMVFAFGMLLSAPALPETAPRPKADTSPPVRVPVELFQGPRMKHLVTPSYPRDELAENREGWVQLGFMVDPSGKPFEITVLDSTGDRTFERAAVRALEQSTFDPGTVNGNPTESAFELKYKFMFDGRATGASPQFIRQYRALLTAINGKDRPAADAAMRALKITNLYEDAYYGFARYYYAHTWGTESEQLAGLRRAIADEDGASYLPKRQFREALIASFSLEIQMHRYGEAVDTWHLLEKGRRDRKLEAQIEPIIQQLKTLQTDNRAYGLSDVMAQGSWELKLFKRHFRIEVGEGYVSQIKLYCAKHYVYFVFDPKLEYDVNAKYGSCSMEMLGAPGTKFTVVQF